MPEAAQTEFWRDLKPIKQVFRPHSLPGDVHPGHRDRRRALLRAAERDAPGDTEYGLSAAVFGADVDAAMAVARQIESGICHVNSSTEHDEPQMPFAA